MPTNIENISKIKKKANSRQVFVGKVEYRANGICGPRTQRDFQLVVIVSGNAQITVNNQVFKLEAGEVALMKPGGHEYYEFSKAGNTEHTWCSTNPSLVPPALAQQLYQAPFFTKVSDNLSQIIEMSLNLPPTPQSLNLLNQLALAALHEYLRCVEDRLPTKIVLPDILTRAMAYMDNHYSERKDISAIAKEVHTSANYLIFLFQKHLHMGAAAYLWKLRLKHASELLQNTGVTIAEVAFQTGFQTPFHFSRLFKKEFRCAPRAFRNQSWKKQK